MKLFLVAMILFVTPLVSDAQTNQGPIPSQAVIENSAAAEWQQAYAGWVSGILSLFALSAVVWQLDGLREQMRSTALQGIWTTWIDIDKWFMEHHSLRPFYYEPNFDLNGISKPPTETELDCASETLLDCYAHIFAQRPALGEDDYKALTRYMRGVYANQPVFRRFVDNKAKDWYDEKFIHFLQGNIDVPERSPFSH
jgi:hypothetical protein